MDKQSRNLPKQEWKVYHQAVDLFDAYCPPPAAHTNMTHVEPPQSVSNWKQCIFKNKLRYHTKFKRLKNRKIFIYLIGPFPNYLNPSGEVWEKLSRNIRDFIEKFFPGFTAEFSPMIIDHRHIKCRTRIHPKSKQTQLFLPDINSFLMRKRPADVYCVCGFSWFDFYPSEDLNHILGEGSFHNGTVAFSFGHYSIFKEMEARQKEWENDFVIEPSIEINDSLGKSSNMSTSGSYIYVTHSEKEEAQKRIQNHEHSCLSSPKTEKCTKILSRSYSDRPTMTKAKVLTKKFHSLVHRSSNNDSCSLHSNMSPSSCGDNNIDYFTDTESMLSMTSVDLDDVNSVDLCHSLVNNIEEPDWDTCDDVEESYLISNWNSLNHVVTSEDLLHDELTSSAVPPGIEFDLNCTVLRRIYRVISHEICHVMGMMHCQYFNCTLNASVSILQVDKQSLFLCPVCLRKLQLALKFRVLERYKGLDQFLTRHMDERFISPPKNSEECLLEKDLAFARKAIDFMTQ